MPLLVTLLPHQPAAVLLVVVFAAFPVLLLLALPHQPA
jgi:hypothetical protein